MLVKCKLILDTFCEVYDLLKPYESGFFWNFQEYIDTHGVDERAVYVLGRQQIKEHAGLVRQLINTTPIKVVMSNPHEGSDTLSSHCRAYGVHDLVLENKIVLISGGDMAPEYPHLVYESFLPKLYDYKENIHAAEQVEDIFSKTNKPYKFLFLNGRNRPHRQFLLERFIQSGIIDQSLWTNLDSYSSDIPIHYLPPNYEVDRYRDQVSQLNPGGAVKQHLFKNEWGEIYLEAAPYIDTYFSLVTETVFAYPHSFRTEKLYKPIAIGHPFIAVANAGYYRDLHNLGFETFGHIIDESFDSIEDNHLRLNRIAQIVEDLSRQDLASFLKECYNRCKYNQQHLAEMRVKVREEFPEHFFQFINERFRI